MFRKNEIEFLAHEKGVGTTDIHFLMFKEETKELMELCVEIAKEERAFKKANDSRFNPERLDMADNISAEFLSSQIRGKL